MNILALLQCTYPMISQTDLRRLSRIILAMLAMTGRVTMLGISRWAEKVSLVFYPLFVSLTLKRHTTVVASLREQTVDDIDVMVAPHAIAIILED